MRHDRESQPPLALLQTAGNRAVASLLGNTGSLQRSPRKPRPLGWDVASVIADRAPALLPYIPADQLVAYQRWVDAGATNREIEGRWQREFDYYMADNRDPAFKQDMAGKLERGEVFGEGARRLQKIKAEKLPAAAKGPVIEVSAADVLADDLKEGGGSPFHAADAALRARWRDKLLAASKLKVLVSDSQWWGVVLDWDGHHLHLEDGRVALSSLQHIGEFAEEYERDVRAPMAELRAAMDELEGYMSTCRDEHQERSNANEEHWYTGIIRHIAEALGEGDQVYPSVKLWNEPQRLIASAKDAFEDGHIDIAVMRYLRSHALGTAQAERYLRYEKRVTSGASIAVTWLERMKAAGTIAAGIASGGLGIAARVGIAGGYAFVREGAQQASGVAHGTQQSMDVGSMAKQATVEAAMSLIGGKIEDSFQTALKARFGAKLASEYGAGIAEQGISVAAATAASAYTGPAQAVLESVITGNRPIPSSLGELADIVADEAIQSGAMEAAMGPIMAKWGGHAGTTPSGTPDAPGTPTAPTAPAMPGTTTPTGATPAVGGGAPTSHSVAAPPGGAGPVAPHVFELAARAHQSHKATDALIDHFGSWEDAVAQIRTGTGDAAGISDAMRKNLLDTLKTRRDALVAELRKRFNAAPAGDTPSTEFGSDVDLNVAGMDAGLREIQARTYLDATHPGWEKRFRMGLMVGSTRMGALGKAVAGLPPALRAGVERHQVLATEAYNLARQARAAGTDQERAELLGRIGDPGLRKQAEAMVALDSADVPKERAKLLIESDRARERAADAGSPAERAQRIQEAMDVQMRANALDAEAYVSGGAIRGVVLGKRDLRPAERYQTVIDQVAMIQHVAAEAGGMRAALRRYETFKYIGRIVDQLRAAGVKDPRLSFLKNHAELVAKVDRAASSSAEARQLQLDDLGQRAHAAGVRADLGIVPGVSEQFLADVHEMLGGVLDQHLPGLRANALGEGGGTGGPPPVPVKLPALGPPTATTPGTATGGGPAAGTESGLTSADALERIVSHSESSPDVAAGTSLQDYAKNVAYAQLSSELKAVGAVPPEIEVRDLGDPNVEGHFDPKRNVIVVNEGAGVKGARQFDASTPEGRRRLLRLLLHESRHAEQWLHALRHMARTRGAGWKDEARAAGVNESIIKAAEARPLPPGQTPEGDLAARVYDEFLGSGKNITRLGQDTKRMAELRAEIGKLETLRDLAASVLQRIPLHKLELRKQQGDLVQRLSSKLSVVQADLEMRTEVYRTLAHEVDARKAEAHLERAFGRRELKAAEKRLEEAEAEVKRVKAQVDAPEAAQALQDAADALEDYRAALLEVGARLRSEPVVAGSR